ncbi:MAG: glycosyltransferase [Actinobacteria bacterium]|nr:glycosyltransferase [Actinomycetota bacterium]
MKGGKRGFGGIEESSLPFITILVPAHNEEKIIHRCLNSIKTQNYPHHKMEVIVIDDGSKDDTFLKVAEQIHASYSSTKNNQYLKINDNHIPVPDRFNGEIKLLANGHSGKPKALNSGVSHMNGSELVVTLDSDVVLSPDALKNTAIAFIKNRHMGAATGNIEISWDMIEERDSNGNIVLDENGKIKSKQLNFSERLLAKCQFLEYLDSFRLGRHCQSILHSTYILAGAFSVFRKDILLESPLYKTLTVSEDFDLTVDFHKKQIHVGYIPDAKAYLEPIINWDDLYSQRARWSRGQIEVCAAHKEIIGNKDYGTVGWLGIPHMLLVDHTLSFPRLIWFFLFLFFPAFGYSPYVITNSLIIIYFFYVALCFLQTLSAYFIVDKETKNQIKETLHLCFVMPLYRIITFYFRMSGYILTLKEPPVWKVIGPLANMKTEADKIKKLVPSLPVFKFQASFKEKIKMGFNVFINKL